MTLSRNPALSILMDAPIAWAWPGRSIPAGATLVGWGRCQSGKNAQHLAALIGGKSLLLEDGFLRGIYPMDPPISLCVDDQGIYYDAHIPCRLESLIPRPLTPEEYKRARDLIALWKEAKLSKHNAAPDYDKPLPPSYVLIIDQVAGDASIGGGLANTQTFSDMLRAARTQNPNIPLIIKHHPLGRGYFPKHIPNAIIIEDPCHPFTLIAGAKAVYTATSQAGFEALLCGVPVRCFGMPFYAGWGLTQDALLPPERRKQHNISLENLVHAALIAYPRYYHPETLKSCEVENVVEYLALQRRERAKWAALGPLYALGFSWRKQRLLYRFMAGADLHFVHKAPKNAFLVLWGSTKAPKECSKIIRVEDGFIRSKGLGAALVRPLSWVFDDRGMHYDPSAPSRLEDILEKEDFPPALLARAHALRESLIEKGVTKYNLCSPPWHRPVGEKYVILVLGQVPGDAALRLCATGMVRSNMDLLTAVRAENPGAYIVYKPHPDVVAQLRRGDEGDPELYCDALVTQGDMAQILTQVDAVHTLSSLAGFEALLRGVPVTCWGAPFYAGWGLTSDRAPIPPRRTRRLCLDSLVAGALILYPSYISQKTLRPTTPERVIAEIHTHKKYVA